MLERLKKSDRFHKPSGPVVLAIMDGVGIGKYAEGDAVLSALTPNLDALKANYPYTTLKAHGMAVGLPSDDDMGNSEVGHNAIGCGRVFDQGASLVNQAIATGALFAGNAWKEVTGNAVQNQSALHLIGLFSDGNVHSHMDHLKALVKGAKEAGVKRVRVHTLLDGRDVEKTSAHLYVEDFERFLAEVNAGDGFDAKIASGGGRMNITMDRYGADWSMVARGWKTHVRGEGRTFGSAAEAIRVLREETEAIDQDLPAFVIVGEDGRPVGPIVDNDSVVFFNFRGDRALELTSAFEDDEFPYFDRGQRPKVVYAGMMQYDGDKGIPSRFLVSPPAIDRTLGEFLANEGVRMFAISETQKYGHVTYFFNGNRLGKFNEQLESYQEITSDILPFEQRPWMKAAEITDAVIAAIESGQYDFIRLNFPNGDMVGHTGVYAAAEIAVETVDLCLARLMKAVRKAGGVMLVSADHGNADDMFEHEKKKGAVKSEEDGTPKAKTAHSLNPVPCHLYAPANPDAYSKALRPGLGISSLAATCMNLLGFEAPEDYDPSLLEPGK